MWSTEIWKKRNVKMSGKLERWKMIIEIRGETLQGRDVKTRKGLGRIYYLAINHTANYISSIQTEYEKIL